MILSSFDNAVLQSEVLSSGASYYFLRPFDDEVLVERIVQLLGADKASPASDIKTLRFGAAEQEDVDKRQVLQGDPGDILAVDAL